MVKSKRTTSKTIIYILLLLLPLVGFWLGKELNNSKNNLDCWKITAEDTANDRGLELIAKNDCDNTEKHLGFVGRYGKSYNVTSDGKMVAYGEPGLKESSTSGSSYKLNSALVIYSIENQQELKRITLKEVKNQFPEFIVERNAGITNIMFSDDNSKIAINYGYTLEPDSDSDLIVYDFTEDEFEVLDVKGVLRQWFGSSALLYEYPDLNRRGEGQFYPTTSETVEVSI